MNNNKGFLKYNKEQLKEGRKDFLNMNGSEEYLTEEFVEFIIYEVLLDIGQEITELRQAIIKKFPKYEGLYSFSECWAMKENKIYVKLIAKPNIYYDEGTEVFGQGKKRITMFDWDDALKNGKLLVIGSKENKLVVRKSMCDEFNVEFEVEYKEIKDE
jgi:hypothetical protein